MADALKEHSIHRVEEKPAVHHKADNDASMQTQLIDSRHVRDPMHLVLLLNSEYGDGNYEVEVRGTTRYLRQKRKLGGRFRHLALEKTYLVTSCR